MRRLCPLLLCLPLLCLLLLGGCGDHSSPPRAEVAAARILDAWDVRRAAAWAQGSPTDLRALYVAGSATGAADVRMLRAWRARGLVVVGLTTQLLAVKVLASSRDRLRLRVTDRVVRAEATAAVRPVVRVALPHDRPSTYLIAMVRTGDVWLVQETTAL